MQRVGITQCRRHVEAFALRIEAGETFLVTRYGRPVAEARPHQQQSTTSA
jgi:antitoxin (DNA-binding transcriptional repressor) of toxin-antitoxin stability system